MLYFPFIQLKVYDLITFGFINRNGVFVCVSDESSYFLIALVKYDMQQVLILKVTSENVAKVKKLL